MGTFALKSAMEAVYLSKIRGWGIIRRYLGRQIIPNNIYKSKKKLNLGSGNLPLPTYINVDILKERKPDIVCDVRKLDFAKENEYDLIRASHILEHFELSQCRQILIDWRRALRKGGYLIICVPDYEALSWRVILDPSGLKLDDETYKNGWISGLFALGLPLEFRHKIIFTYKTLRDLLNDSGFKTIGRLNYFKEEPHILGINDNSCNLFSLNLAAIKI